MIGKIKLKKSQKTLFKPEYFPGYVIEYEKWFIGMQMQIINT